jgi:exopolysaccharide production protein ExoZ
VAALLVVLFHLGGALGAVKYFGYRLFGGAFDFGDTGVEFFFVLSGFIITWVHAQDIGKPNRLPPYLRKRAVRIYPVYWIIFAGVFLLALSSTSLRQTVPHDYLTIIKSLALVPQDPVVEGGTGAPVIIAAWSMQYEVLFYSLFAVFILSRSLGLLVACALLINFISCQFGQCTFSRSFLSDNLILLFAYGAFIAYLCRKSIKLTHPMLIALFGVGAFLATGALEVVVGREMWVMDRRLVFGFFSGIVILGLVRAEDSGKIRINLAWLALLGDASYSLYLIHYPLISILCKFAVSIGLAGTSGALIAFPTLLTACVLISAAFYVIVERPVLRFLRDKRALPSHDRSTPVPVG